MNKLRDSIAKLEAQAAASATPQVAKPPPTARPAPVPVPAKEAVPTSSARKQQASAQETSPAKRKVGAANELPFSMRCLIGRFGHFVQLRAAHSFCHLVTCYLHLYQPMKPWKTKLSDLIEATIYVYP